MGSLCADRETKGNGALQDSQAWAAGLKVRAGLYILAGRMSSDSRISMCDKMSRKDRLAVDCNLNSIIWGAREKGTRHRYTSRPLQLNPDIDARSSNQAGPGGCIDLNR